MCVCVATGCCWDNDRVRLSLITHCSWARQAPLPPLSRSLSLLLYLCLFLSSYTSPIRECWWDIFCRKKKTHTSLGCRGRGCWQGQRRVVVLYKGCICLLRIDSLNWLPKPPSSPYISPSFYYPAHSGLLFFDRPGHSWNLVIPHVMGKTFFSLLSFKKKNKKSYKNTRAEDRRLALSMEFK